MSISDSRVLQLALEHLESQRRDIDAEIADLKSRPRNNNGAKRRGRPRKMASGGSEPSSTEPETQPKKRMSAAHRTAIAEAMKQRWAERKKEAGNIENGRPPDVDKTNPRLIKASRPTAEL